MASPLDFRDLDIEFLAPFGERGGRARGCPVHYTQDGGRTPLCGAVLSRTVSWRIRTYSSPDYKPERMCKRCEARALESFEKAWEIELERKQLSRLRAVDTKILVKALRRRGVVIAENALSEPGRVQQVPDEAESGQTYVIDEASLAQLAAQLKEVRVSFQELEETTAELLGSADAVITALAEALASLEGNS